MKKQKREIEEEGIKKREVYAEMLPRRVLAAEIGRSLEIEIGSLWTWGNGYMAVRSKRLAL